MLATNPRKHHQKKNLFLSLSFCYGSHRRLLAILDTYKKYNFIGFHKKKTQEGNISGHPAAVLLWERKRTVR
jgi:hypothetical protein